jgi:hypothetical protein
VVLGLGLPHARPLALRPLPLLVQRPAPRLARGRVCHQVLLFV